MSLLFKCRNLWKLSQYTLKNSSLIPILHLSIRFSIPPAAVEELRTEDHVDIHHKQQNVFVALQLALVFVPHLLSANAKTLCWWNK